MSTRRTRNRVRPRTPAARAVAATAALAAASALAPSPAHAEPSPSRDHLVVTVRDSGRPSHDDRFDLFCHPASGDHPDVTGACERLDELTVWGRDPFAPVPPDAMCTSMYGGPATAHVEGVWAGRPVDADFSRGTGCETARWDEFVPLLPRIGA